MLHRHVITGTVLAGAIAAGVAGYPYTQKSEVRSQKSEALTSELRPLTSVSASAYFAPPASPLGSPTAAAVRELAQAKHEVLVQCYSFTNAAIAQALADAHQRGVAVSVVADKSDLTGKGTLIGALAAEGIPVVIDDKHAIAHNKVMVIDQAVVITGSFNFTEAAEHANAENLVILRSPELAKRYADNWKTHHDHSRPFRPSQ